MNLRNAVFDYWIANAEGAPRNRALMLGLVGGSMKSPMVGVLLAAVLGRQRQQVVLPATTPVGYIGGSGGLFGRRQASVRAGRPTSRCANSNRGSSCARCCSEPTVRCEFSWALSCARRDTGKLVQSDSHSRRQSIGKIGEAGTATGRAYSQGQKSEVDVGVDARELFILQQTCGFQYGSRPVGTLRRRQGG